MLSCLCQGLHDVKRLEEKFKRPRKYEGYSKEKGRLEKTIKTENRYAVVYDEERDPYGVPKGIKNNW